MTSPRLPLTLAAAISCSLAPSTFLVVAPILVRCGHETIWIPAQSLVEVRHLGLHPGIAAGSYEVHGENLDGDIRMPLAACPQLPQDTLEVGCETLWLVEGPQKEHTRPAVELQSRASVGTLMQRRSSLVISALLVTFILPGR